MVKPISWRLCKTDNCIAEFELVRLLLVRARAKIADENNWTRRAYARDKDGVVCDFNEPEACRWCGTGALFCEIRKMQLKNEDIHISGKVDVGELALAHLKDASMEKHSASPAEVNDNGNHADVLQMYDAAIRDAHDKLPRPGGDPA